MKSNYYIKWVKYPYEDRAKWQVKKRRDFIWDETVFEESDYGTHARESCIKMMEFFIDQDASAHQQDTEVDQQEE